MSANFQDKLMQRRLRRRDPELRKQFEQAKEAVTRSIRSGEVIYRGGRHQMRRYVIRLWVLFLLTYSQGRQSVGRFPTVESRLLNPP